MLGKGKVKATRKKVKKGFKSAKRMVISLY